MVCFRGAWIECIVGFVVEMSAAGVFEGEDEVYCYCFKIWVLVMFGLLRWRCMVSGCHIRGRKSLWWGGDRTVWETAEDIGRADDFRCRVISVKWADLKTICVNKIIVANAHM